MVTQSPWARLLTCRVQPTFTGFHGAERKFDIRWNVICMGNYLRVSAFTFAVALEYHEVKNEHWP